MSVWQPCALALSTSILLISAVSAQDYAEFRFRHSVQDLNTCDSNSESRGLVRAEGILFLDIGPHRFVDPSTVVGSARAATKHNQCGYPRRIRPSDTLRPRRCRRRRPTEASPQPICCVSIKSLLM